MNRCGQTDRQTERHTDSQTCSEGKDVNGIEASQSALSSNIKAMRMSVLEGGMQREGTGNMQLGGGNS